MQTISMIYSWLKSNTPLGAQLSLDTRTLGVSDVFVAVTGTKYDGRLFIEKAIEKGASAVLLEASETPLTTTPTVPFLEVESLQSRLGEIASCYYGAPNTKLRGVLMTGTNGKTTISHLSAQLLSALGEPCAAIGTMGTFFQGQTFKAPALTTPDVISVHRLLARCVQEKAKAFAMEASSIGLEQGRLNGVSAHCAIFTNLTRDHLDYHHNMQAYQEAKAKLFEIEGLKEAVINADDLVSPAMVEAAKAQGLNVWVTGSDRAVRAIKGADRRLALLQLAMHDTGMSLTIDFEGKAYQVRVPLLGRFNAENILCVIAMALSMGYPMQDVLKNIAQIKAPLGRMQMVQVPGHALGVVDYSHTPDALEKALEALRPLAEHRQGQLWVVFGCGGDRDAGKRPIMGQVASRLADQVCITSDNPRSEEPVLIVQEIAQGATNPMIVPEREGAIRSVFSQAKPEDVILVAGKGHEDYQEIQGIRHPFSDVKVIESIQ